MAISIIEIDGNSHPLGASAANVAFDGTGAGMEAGTVQEAIEEVSVLAAEGAQSGVVDNLETVDGQKALSAGMGNKLDGKASVVFNHMHWVEGSSSPNVDVGSHERYYCPENHTIYHFYGRIYASEPNTKKLSYLPSKEVIYYDLETATAWRWDGTNMVLAVHPPYFMIAYSTSSATIDGYNPVTPSGFPYPRLVWFSELGKLVYFYMDGQTPRYVAFDPDPNRVYVYLVGSPKVVQWDGSAWVNVIDISSKANAADVANTYATKSELTSGLSGKQNTLTFDDAPGNTDNPVKSRGIKQAIDFVTPTIDANGKWVIGGVATDKDAQGPRGNTVLVNENAVGIQGLIVNNVVDGGEEEILSAEMGKVLRVNVMKMFNALGAYAFPEGKPILNWGSTVINHSINVNGVSGLTISDVEVDGTSVGSLPLQVVEGKSLSFKLNLPSNLYIYDAVAIKVGGVDITNNTGVWDESTGVVNIASVTDDVVVTATSLTYVQDGLVAMFDGKNVDSANNKWVDKMESNRILNLYNCDVQSDHVYFNGTNAYAFAESQNTDYNGVDVNAATGTIEAVLTDEKTATAGEYAYPFVNKLYAAGHKLALTIMHTTAGGTNRIVAGWTQATDVADAESSSFPKCWNLAVTSLQSVSCLSVSATRCYLNGQTKEKDTGPIAEIPNSNSSLGISTRINASNNRFYGKGSVYCIRVYDATLTPEQILRNYRVDQKRFNLT